MFRGKTARPTFRTKNGPHSLQYSTLENRKLLATSVSLTAGTLTINGDTEDNLIVLQPNLTTNRYEVTESHSVGETPVVLAEFDFGTITDIVFGGGAGNDSMNNMTDIPMYAVGHLGDDVFVSGAGDDTLLGGPGNDTFYAGDGADTVRGHDGQDSIFGQEGNDRLFGGSHNDNIFGGDGDDFIFGEFGDDTAFGGSGRDFVYGFLGNDSLFGDAGDDFLYGQIGDDLLDGGEGIDRLRGSGGNDRLFGRAGNDALRGDSGDDEMDGGDGNDLMYGFNGNDIFYGGPGNDTMYGQNGNDELNGGPGEDIMRGGNDDDILRGGPDNDNMRGESGNDRLYGNAGVDTLVGGDGNDGLTGGIGQPDRLFGNSGTNRFLVQSNDIVNDLASDDAIINFSNDSSDWTDAEIELADSAFHVIHNRNGSTRLLKDNLVSDNLTFTKVTDIAGPAMGRNTLQQSQGQTTGRLLEFEEFDESKATESSDFVISVYTQLGRNWDSSEELVAGNSETPFNTFLLISQWTPIDPGLPEFHQSNDGNWFYNSTTGFTDDTNEADPQNNPFDDFAATFEFYFDAYANNQQPGALQGKYDWFDIWVVTL